MSFNLMDAAKGLFTSELLGKASSFLGESEGGISKAMTGIVPTVLSGLVSKTSTHEGAGAVAHMVQEQSNAGILGNLGSFFGNDGGGLLNKGVGLLSSLFGGKADGITGLISNFAGVKSSTATSLLSMALPAVLGLIGKQVGGGGASGIASLLSSQKDNIAAAMPAGLNLSSILGGAGSTVSNAASAAKTATTHYAAETVEKTGGGAMRFLLPLLLLAAAAMGAWYFFGKSKGDNTEHTAATVTETAKDTTTTVTPPVMVGGKESLKVKLADGTEIDAFKGGVEDKLVAFLSTNWKTLGADSLKKIWYDFDNLNFDLGKSTITTESMGQVKNLAAILKAYPDAKIKVGGYTDKKGDAAGNKKLSQSRADAVIAALKGLGSNAAQLLGGEGYGSEFATVPAEASDEERRKDRRTAVSVRN